MASEFSLVYGCNKTAWQNYGVSIIKSKHLWKNTLQKIKYNLQSFNRALLKKNKKCKCWVLLFSKGKEEQLFYQVTVALDRQRDIPLTLHSFTPGQWGGKENNLSSPAQRTLRRIEISLLRILQHLQNRFYIITLFWWNKQLDFSKSKFKTRV